MAYSVRSWKSQGSVLKKSCLEFYDLFKLLPKKSICVNRGFVGNDSWGRWEIGCGKWRKRKQPAVSADMVVCIGLIIKTILVFKITSSMELNTNLVSETCFSNVVRDLLVTKCQNSSGYVSEKRDSCPSWHAWWKALSCPFPAFSHLILLCCIVQPLFCHAWLH